MRSRTLGVVLSALGALGIATAISASTAQTPANNDEFKQHMDAGTSFYEQGKSDDAIREFKSAVAVQPNSSLAHLWLGRALGRKAEKANSVQAAFMVGGVRKEFERAVGLDPRSLEARSDLLEFYLDAPSSFGGGIAKAQMQAEAIARLDPAEGRRARARIAEKQMQYDIASHENRATPRR